MERVFERIPRGSRVLVIRLRSLGDCVLTTPAIEILHSARPDLEVAVVVEDRFAAVFSGNPHIAQILPPRVSGVARWGAFFTLNLHGGTRSMGLTAASNARVRAGFEHFRGGAVYNVKIPRAQDILGEERTVHTAEHLASAMFHLGAPVGEIPRARLYATPLAAATPYAVMHPFASEPAKTWPAASFLAVADHLKRDWGLGTVFVGAAGDDFAPFAGHQTAAGESLEQVKSRLAGASLFVGNDSGPAHMAAAFGVPVAVIFGNSEPEIWRPWKTPAEVLINRDNIAAIEPDQVVAALERLRVNA